MAIYDKSITNTSINDENLKAFCLKSGNEKDVHSLLFEIIVILVNIIRQEK
jgi:hypothetical protein